MLHIATTLTPFEMFIGGKKITRIDLMKPKPVSEINTSHYKNGLSLGTLFPNDQFVIREHRGWKKWQKVNVLQKISCKMWNVFVTGKVLTRHWSNKNKSNS